jgi:hypothetical protein
MASVDARRVSHNGMKELDFSGLPVEKLVQIRCGIYKANCRLQPNLTSETSSMTTIFPKLRILYVNNRPLKLPECCNIALQNKHAQAIRFQNRPTQFLGDHAMVHNSSFPKQNACDLGEGQQSTRPPRFYEVVSRVEFLGVISRRESERSNMRSW